MNERHRPGDRLPFVAVGLGTIVALASARAPAALATGVALALGGVLLALRGERPLPAPRWLAAALLVAVGATVASSLLRLFEDWRVGQGLAEGAPLGDVLSTARPYVRARAAMRSVALFAGLSFLLGAVTTRLPSSGKQKGSG